MKVLDFFFVLICAALRHCYHCSATRERMRNQHKGTSDDEFQPVPSQRYFPLSPKRSQCHPIIHEGNALVSICRIYLLASLFSSSSCAFKLFPFIPLARV
jgi:hypothetical protein